MPLRHALGPCDVGRSAIVHFGRDHENWRLPLRGTVIAVRSSRREDGTVGLMFDLQIPRKPPQRFDVFDTAIVGITVSGEHRKVPERGSGYPRFPLH
ncbi:hypothetical protein D1871_19620 [Nakamurella silvestris]|nr:hypothetical protein D1871_19620 [Nakamurella silvestris]